MGNELLVDPDMPFVDQVYQVLREEGSPLNYRDLFTQVLASKGEDINQWSPERIATLYTDFNLDHRFNHVGDGEWGLLEWVPRAKSRIVVVSPPVVKPRVERRLEAMDDMIIATDEGEAPEPAEAAEENEEEWE